MIVRFYILLVLSLLSLAPSARAWWDKEWTVRKSIVIETAAPEAAVGGPVGSAVVLLRLHDGNFQFAAGKEDGSDIRVVAEDDKTVLPSHLERFDSLLNEGFLWVKVPEVKAGGKTTLWLYSGNQGDKMAAGPEAKAIYDAETVLVYHFSEKGAPASDATGHGNTAQNAGVAVTGSLIAGGLRLDGRTPITIPGSESLNWTAGGALTFTAWIKPAALTPQAIVFSRREGANAFVVGLANGAPFVEINGQRASAPAVEAGTWHHLAIISEASKTTLYVDGEAAPALAASVPAFTGPLLLGGDSAEGALGFAGEVDELTLAKTARPPGWVKLAALSQGSGPAAGKVIALGADEQGGESGGGGGHPGHFKVIVDSLDFAGWVVIDILGFMLVVSWYVMITKVRYLNALAKGNGLFMREWGQVVNDLTVLDHGSDGERTRSLGGRLDKAAQRRMRASSVYRIYHIGVEEIRHRLQADHSLKQLSGRSIQSIRASLDGALVREKQTIDKLIVLLTICISGGPFLGLLGTVVGVMITFAAVAAAGDVNVNAIAPGIAAALLATVAGLAVAIPSLFGYNYILSRVKDATADMHVFIDEFITRMAEFYSEPERREAVIKPEYAKRSGTAEPELPVLEGAGV